jgi:hypothetical protein
MLVPGWLIEDTTWIARTAQTTPQPIETRAKNRRPGINEITSATMATTAAAVKLDIAPGLNAPSELKVVEIPRPWMAKPALIGEFTFTHTIWAERTSRADPTSVMQSAKIRGALKWRLFTSPPFRLAKRCTASALSFHTPRTTNVAARSIHRRDTETPHQGTIK